jgi:hypothetical protein
MDHVSNLPIPADATWAELTAEPFLRAFAEEVGVEVLSLDCSDRGQAHDATMEWVFPTDRPGIPELARRFLPAQVHLSWQQSWGPLAGERADGRLEVQLRGRPAATATGRSALVGAAAGCSLRTSTTTKADLPFPLAGRVESIIDREVVGWILQVQARVLVRRAAD